MDEIRVRGTKDEKTVKRDFISFDADVGIAYGADVSVCMEAGNDRQDR